MLASLGDALFDNDSAVQKSLHIVIFGDDHFKGIWEKADGQRVVGNCTEDYSAKYYYDNNGNMTAKQTIKTDVPSSSVSVSSSAALSGRSSNTGMKTYRYDAFNRLTNYNSGSVEASYTYNANNLRAGKTVNRKKTEFVWNGQNLAAETKAGITNTYTYDMTGVHIANKDGNVTSYLKDFHGNILGRATADGAMVEALDNRMDYDAFGNQWIGSTPDPFGYCGEYYDGETGLIYLRNRYYDRSTGRFISEDPIKDGLNWYSYCAGNPVVFSDSWGLWMDDDEKLSKGAQVYIRYYTKGWENADEAYKNATTDIEREEAQRKMDFYHAAAGDIRYLDAKGLVTGTVHDVQVFKQGSSKLCWAYSQVMVEDYQTGGEMTQAQANIRAREIAESVHGTGKDSNGQWVWNKGGWPTNSQDVIKQEVTIQTVNSFKDLSAYISDGPVYAYYANESVESPNESVAHLIVVAGTSSTSGHSSLVQSNNPWGDVNIQTYEDFKAGIPNDGSNPAMTFKGILRV